MCWNYAVASFAVGMNQDQEVPAGVGEFTRFVSRNSKIYEYYGTYYKYTNT